MSNARADAPEQPQRGGSHQHAYAALTPELILDALDAVGMRCDGRLAMLSSYENRVVLLHLDEPVTDATGQKHSAVVAKFYRPERWSDAAILEEHAFAFELQAADIPMVAPLMINGTSLHHHAGFAYSISPKRGGRGPELDDWETLEWTGRFLARIHSVGAVKPFVHRPTLNTQTFGYDSMAWLLENDAIALDVRSTWAKACETALGIASKYIAAYDHTTLTLGNNHSKIAVLRLHGDCHPGNILWTPTDLPQGGPHFVDLDDARMGPAVQDLWMLASGSRAQRAQQLSALVEGYEQFRPFDRCELVLIEPLRTLRLIHYSAWLARRWSDPTFPINFPYFGSSDYWQGEVAMLHEQIEAMDTEPLMV